MHLGKANHFRKEGISIPAEAQQSDYTNLDRLLSKIKPLKVYFLGDLFHSDYNRDWDNFRALIEKYTEIQFVLVRGNHDIIDHELFRLIGIQVVDRITDETFVYTHEPMPTVELGKMNISGHIHPGFILSGSGRQSLKLPCFYRTDSLFLLPAFGVLTGLYGIEKMNNTCVYVVLPGSVQQIN